jgi:ankyrin repeat protein
LEVVKYLISEGADIQIKDARGFDPLDEAIREGRLEVADYLINEALVRNQCVDF